MPVITPVLGDITTHEVDAVVNAANNAMRGGAGVDGAIHRRGGPAILRDCIARFPNGLATGDAGWTTAGDLPARWVIHTVGPKYKAGERDRSLLESCYRRSLAVADELGARTVAFPLISAGAYAWPLADAIAAAVDTIATTQTRVEQVRLVAVEEEVAKQIRAAVWLRCPPSVGSATIGALFDRQPLQFGLRGDAYLWRELRAQFADTPLPEHWHTLRSLLTAAIEHVVGQPLGQPLTGGESVYVPQFDPGHGMSAGAVHVTWWRQTGLPILLDRYDAVRESR